MDPTSSIKIDLPPDSPLNLISTSMNDSRATSRGGAIVLDLHMGLTLRNSGVRHIRGVTLLITAQEFAPGGKGSVARPSIDVPPGENFTLPVDIRLVRPVRETSGPLVQAGTTGRGAVRRSEFLWSEQTEFATRADVLGKSKRSAIARISSRLCRRGAKAGSRREMLASIAKQADRPQLDVSRLSRNGRAVGSAVPATDHVADSSSFPESPQRAGAAVGRLGRNFGQRSAFATRNRGCQ